MTVAADPLAGWRAYRATLPVASVPSVPGGAKPPGTLPNPQKTVTVPGVPGVPAENANAGARTPATTPAAGLPDLATAIRAALAEGAEREADPGGWLVLVRPDGRRLVLLPELVAALAAACVMPELPEAVERAEAARCARPSFWTVPGDLPQQGDRCLCGGREWWRAEGGATWCCGACHPATDTTAERRTTASDETTA